MGRPRFRKQIDFGLGFSVPVIREPVQPAAGADGAYEPIQGKDGPRINLDTRVPLWEQVEAYAHEILHAAIDFDLYVRRELSGPMRAEAERTRRELLDSEAKEV